MSIPRAFRKTKDPNDILDYTLNWADWLDGDTIAAATWTVPRGITSLQQVHTTTTTTIWLSGGAAGATYTPTCRITTASTPARVKDFSFSVSVSER